MVPQVLSVSVCRKPFKPPCSSKSNGYNYNEDLTRRLSVRKRFVPWGSSRPALVETTNHFNPNVPVPPITVAEEEDLSLPPGVLPLVLWHPQDHDDQASNFTTIAVDPLLVRFLRPHQRCFSCIFILPLLDLEFDTSSSLFVLCREGVQFMFDCVSGLCSTANIHGCILADDMGSVFLISSFS